ncbi:MAG: hypothetical protein EGP73_03610 [Alistipes indistinctus]|nr:hypothetical protein [Alistipes indistinctus]
MNSRRRVQVFRTAIGFSNASDCLYEVSAVSGRYLVIHSIETEINVKPAAGMENRQNVLFL